MIQIYQICDVCICEHLHTYYIHIRLITKLTGATWTTNDGSVNKKLKIIKQKLRSLYDVCAAGLVQHIN